MYLPPTSHSTLNIPLWYHQSNYSLSVDTSCLLAENLVTQAFDKDCSIYMTSSDSPIGDCNFHITDRSLKLREVTKTSFAQ